MQEQTDTQFVIKEPQCSYSEPCWKINSKLLIDINTKAESTNILEEV